MFDCSSLLYFVGVDVALRANHVAGILDDRCRPVVKSLSFGHSYDDLQRLCQQVRKAVPKDAQLVWGCEATGAGWRPIAAYLQSQGEAFSLENAASIARLRKVRDPHLKTDSVDARTIGKALFLRVLEGERLSAPPSPQTQAQRSLMRRINGIKESAAKAKTRALGVLCDTLLPGLDPKAHSWLGPTLLPVLMYYADPRCIAKKSRASFVTHARKLGGARVPEEALNKLHETARSSVRIYGNDRLLWDQYALLLRDAIQELRDLQARMEPLQEALNALIDQTCSAEEREWGLTVPGVGEETLQLALAMCGGPANWPCFKAIKSFGGAVPIIKDSGNTRGIPRMSKLGEPALRKLIYLLGDNARRVDAQLAAHYYDQMVNKGKGHVAATFSTGLRVLNALRAVMRNRRPYEFLDPQTKQPISREQSRELAKAYHVPEKIRAARRKQKRDSDRRRRASEGRAEALPKAD